ncbi:hypothetical protein UFOVP434_60 [uncultured Caudovirales phage]|uniref:Uncharacterized protein n=1 Tax=uncultured Caudovirales phage TaxID=2100421 RepID=A0A6J5MH21_9CAUD|nr:hypothetical protein UFOVP434_60 [uncultured Caudovirales phage]
MAGLSNRAFSKKYNQSAYAAASQFLSRIYRPYYNFPLKTPTTGQVDATLDPVLSSANVDFTSGGSITASISATLAAVISAISTLLSFNLSSNASLGQIIANATINFFQGITATISATLGQINAAIIAIFGNVQPVDISSLAANVAVIQFGETSSNVVRNSNKVLSTIFISGFSGATELSILGSNDSENFYQLSTFSPQKTPAITDLKIIQSQINLTDFVFKCDKTLLRNFRYIRIESNSPITSTTACIFSFY